MRWTGDFIDDGTAPEFFANGLQSVEVMGDVSRFVMFAEKRKRNGAVYRVAPFTFIVPNAAIGPAICTTVQAVGHTVIAPVTRLLMSSGSDHKRH